jgi:hypothetical protein
MPLSPIPEENENNSPRMPFQNGMKKTKNTNTYKNLQENPNKHKAYLKAMSSRLNETASNFVPSSTRKAARKAAKKVRRAAEVAARAAAANAAKKSSKKSAKKRTRKNRR